MPGIETLTTAGISCSSISTNEVISICQFAVTYDHPPPDETIQMFLEAVLYPERIFTDQISWSRLMRFKNHARPGAYARSRRPLV
jgi:hypothetical protein